MFWIFKNTEKKESKTDTKKICVMSKAIFLDEFLTGTRRKKFNISIEEEMKNTQQIQSQQQSPQEVSPDIV